MIDGPERGLALIERPEVAGKLGGGGGRWLHTTRADLLRRLHRHGDAAAAYRRALELPSNKTNRDFIVGRIEEMEAATGE
jgi:RNA polymerase sigma-70 factor (ECF subfamily)